MWVGKLEFLAHQHSSVQCSVGQQRRAALPVVCRSAKVEGKDESMWDR